MNEMDTDVAITIQTELKLYLTQQLHIKGYLSDEMCTNAMALILKEAKNQRKIQSQGDSS
ncbi:MAG: hypothetical protein FWC89_11485 [Defluviitaleaceae bacterium]|nr:hypothetical protein [Defluviitaleaceae bacterium]